MHEAFVKSEFIKIRIKVAESGFVTENHDADGIRGLLCAVVKSITGDVKTDLARQNVSDGLFNLLDELNDFGGIYKHTEALKSDGVNDMKLDCF